MALEPTQRNRLRWRCRRGLLELDIILSRFLERYENELSERDAEKLSDLLDYPENELLDIVLGRSNRYGVKFEDLVQRLRAA